MKLFNLARMTSTTTGTGTLTLGNTVSGCVTFANAGVLNGDVVSYGISDGANSEVGWGTYTSSGTTLSRDTVLTSTNSGNKISCTGSQQVYITALAQDLAQANGWIPVTGTFSYASASTINVSSGAAAVYSVGDRLKWMINSVQKYGTVVSIADTVLTIAVNTDYPLTSGTWTLPYYSHQSLPVGFPQWFNYTPTLSVAGGTAPTYTGDFINRYCRIGNHCTVYGKWYNASGGVAGAGANILFTTLPFTAYQENIQTGSCGLRNGATSLGGIGILLSETTFSLLKSDWSFVQGVDQNNTDRILTFTFTYEAA